MPEALDSESFRPAAVAPRPMLASQFTLNPLPAAAVQLAIGIGLIWLLCRGEFARAALRKVLRQPALLVPAAMTVAALIVIHRAVPQIELWETPFRQGRGLFSSLLGWRNWVGLGVVAAGLAGQVGLLEAIADGRRPDGFTMLAGIRRHFRTFVVAKLAFGLGVHLLADFAATGRAGSGLILFLVPNLFIAPVLGTASLHPGQPLAALRAAFELAIRRVFAVGWPVLFQALIMLGLVLSTSRVAWTSVEPELLVDGASTVGFNQMLFLTRNAPGGVATIATTLSVFVSVVFVTAHWHGATNGYRAPLRAAEADPREATT